jgi:class 3 adenylate cyclase/CHASE2 domain-containing sensor protein
LQVGFFALLAVLCTALPFLPPIASADLFLLDHQFRLLRSQGPKQITQDVTVIGIDDETYKQFPEPFALWHAHFGEMLSALALAKPAVVGFDINFPDRSFDSVLPGLDRKLLSGLLDFKRTAPVVLGVTVEESGKVRRIYPPFISVAGENGSAYVLWRQDSDHVVRRFNPKLGNQGQEVPTLVGTMAMHIGLRPEPGMIDFALGPAFDYVPMHQVIEWGQKGDIDALKKRFDGKPVLVGSVLPFIDRHYQPVNLAGWEENDNYVPGVFIHAQALRSLLAGNLIQTVPTVSIVLLCLFLSGLWWLAHRPWIALALTTATVFALLALSTRFLGQGTYLPVAAAAVSVILAAGMRTTFEAVLQMLERQRLRRAFGSYVSPQVMDEILQGTLKPGLHGERKQLCLLFSDVRGFTTLSEHLAPEDVIAILNRYFDQMTTAIQGNDGTIDKFMGDGIMAFFGAPKPLDNPARLAFLAASDMLVRLDKLNQEFEAEGRQPLKIGIGLHMGYAVVGNMGSEQRNEYTAIGDVVNTCSRLEGLTKTAGYPLLVSRPVMEVLQKETQFDPLGEMPVKGRAAVEVFGWPQKDKASTNVEERKS